MTLVEEIVQNPSFGPSVATIVVTVLTFVAAAVGKVGRDVLKQNVNEKQLNTLTFIAYQAVAAAEQTGLNKTGAEKKQAALEYVNDLLKHLGIQGVDPFAIEAAIEAQVLDQFGAETKAPKFNIPAAPAA